MLGRERYPNVTRLQLPADCGGSNGNLVLLSQVALTWLVKATYLEITFCHFPPGASKWNRIEHRLFSYITVNWRGKPLARPRNHLQPDLRHGHLHRPRRATPASTTAATPTRSASPAP